MAAMTPRDKRRDTVSGVRPLMTAAVILALIVSMGFAKSFGQETKEIQIILRDDYLEPSTIEVVRGDTVRLTLSNQGQRTHAFTIDRFGVNEVLNAGQTVRVEFVASKGGRFLYYCGLHAGMEGWLKVVVPNDTTPPTFLEIKHTPQEPGPGQSVMIRATISDESGVEQTQLVYAVGSDDWQTLPMSMSLGDEWVGFIPASEVGATVKYYVKAKDYSGLSAESEPVSFLVKSEGVAPGSKEIKIVARRFAFEPGRIEVNQGDEVLLRLSSDDVTHGFYIDGYGVNTTIVPGKEVLITFKADQVGKFKIRCIMVCGSLHPFMVGELVVRPNFPFQASVLAQLGVVAAGIVIFLRQVRTPSASLGNSEAALGFRRNLLRYGVMARILKHRVFPFVLVVPDLMFFALIIVTGIWGNPLGSMNFSIIFTWIVWWTALKLLFVPLAARFWCTVCPIPIAGEWVQRGTILAPGRRGFNLGWRWPEKLRNLWIVNALFLSVALFSVVVTTSPFLTATVLLGLMAAAFLLHLLFKGRAFCRYVCPVSGFLSVYSMFSSTELRVQDPEVCRVCFEKPCVRGSADGFGCPWFQYPGNLGRNNYCGLCLECLKTCTKENVVFNLRPLGKDLGVTLGRTFDEAWVALIMLGVAIWYIVVMQGPWGWLKTWGSAARYEEFGIYATLFFGFVLIVIPGVYAVVALASRVLSGSKAHSWRQAFSHHSYALVPMGIMAWIAFSLPVLFVNGASILSALSDPFGWGWDLFGTKQEHWSPFMLGVVPPLQVLATGIGLFFSLRVAAATPLAPHNAFRQKLAQFIPICLFLFGVAVLLTALFTG